MACRDLRCLWVGETISKLGSTVSAVIVPLVAVVTLHAGAFIVGLLSAAAWLPWLVIGLPAGAWVDRLARRRVMLAADAVSLALFASVPLAAWLGVLSIGQLLAVALLGGAAGVFFQTAYQTYLPTLVDRPQLAGANALVQGSESAAQVAGPGLAGAMVTMSGAVSGMLVDAASFLASALCLLAIRTRSRRSPRRGPVRGCATRSARARGSSSATRICG